MHWLPPCSQQRLPCCMRCIVQKRAMYSARTRIRLRQLQHSDTSADLGGEHITSTPSRPAIHRTGTTWAAAAVAAARGIATRTALLLHQESHDAALAKVHRLVERVGEGRLRLAAARAGLRRRSADVMGLRTWVGGARRSALLRELPLPALACPQQLLVVGGECLLVHDTPPTVHEHGALGEFGLGGALVADQGDVHVPDPAAARQVGLSHRRMPLHIRRQCRRREQRGQPGAVLGLDREEATDEVAYLLRDGLRRRGSLAAAAAATTVAAAAAAPLHTMS
jgi:hypothetical protein